VSVGIQRDDAGEISIDRLLEAVQGFLDDGYRRIKIKIKPGYDVEPVQALRDAFGDGLPLQVDGNSAYSLEHVDVFRALDRFGLALIEQPLAHDDLFDHAKLQARIETPLCLDESIESVEDARHAIELGSCRIINIKHTRVGGLHPAVAVHDVCRDAGIPVWCGGMLESAIGQCHALAVASLPNFTLAADCAPSERYFERDLIRPFVQLENGTLEVPTAPGLGYDVDEDALEELTVQTAVVRA
jgi:O-succinylbenzoate synthase